jgi:hypothetical protein
MQPFENPWDFLKPAASRYVLGCGGCLQDAIFDRQVA